MFDMVTGAFGKDPTLTGRSYLWAEGLAAARENPIFGRGYQAYWVHGFADAERLWEEFYITARTGFHFHSTYVDTLVETGLVGLVLLAMLVIGLVAGPLVRLLNGRDDAAAQVLFGLAAMLLVRSLVEVDVITPYVVGSFLLYYGVASSYGRPWMSAAGRRRSTLAPGANSHPRSGIRPTAPFDRIMRGGGAR
jgi:exopolysaccharide production protein ExoQ